MTTPVSVAWSIALLLVLLPAKVKAGECADHSNGCSIPLDLDFFYRDLFTPACVKHDICYGCVRKVSFLPVVQWVLFCF